jgi:hypothetical protein
MYNSLSTSFLFLVYLHPAFQNAALTLELLVDYYYSKRTFNSSSCQTSRFVSECLTIRFQSSNSFGPLSTAARYSLLFGLALFWQVSVPNGGRAVEQAQSTEQQQQPIIVHARVRCNPFQSSSRVGKGTHSLNWFLRFAPTRARRRYRCDSVSESLESGRAPFDVCHGYRSNYLR